MRPNIPEVQTRSVLLKNMFDPAEETEANWDKDLADDVRAECTTKYGPVRAISVDASSKGEIMIGFDDLASAAKAVDGLNNRWFGGRQIRASYVSDLIMDAQAR